MSERIVTGTRARVLFRQLNMRWCFVLGIVVVSLSLCLGIAFAALAMKFKSRGGAGGISASRFRKRRFQGRHVGPSLLDGTDDQEEEELDDQEETLMMVTPSRGGKKSVSDTKTEAFLEMLHEPRQIAGRPPTA